MQAVVIEHGRNLLAWESTRQAFVTQSTAEAELIGYNEGLQLGEAAAALLKVLEMDVAKRLQGDCKAALAQVLGDTGPWRTRHLRLRSAKLREALREPAMQWTAEHKPGADLSADGLTKALQGRAFDHFVQLLRMESCTDHGDMVTGPKVASVSVKQNSMVKAVAVGACVAAGVALLEIDPTVAGVVLVAGSVLWEVVGRAMKSPETRKKTATRSLNKNSKKGVKRAQWLVLTRAAWSP